MTSGLPFEPNVYSSSSFTAEPFAWQTQHAIRTRPSTVYLCPYPGCSLGCLGRDDTFANHGGLTTPSGQKIQSHMHQPTGTEYPFTPKSETPNDFTLYPEEVNATPVLARGEADFLRPNCALRNSQVYIPWTSPGTRLKENTTFLRSFNEKYEPEADGADIGSDPAVGGTAGVEPQRLEAESHQEGKRSHSSVDRDDCAQSPVESDRDNPGRPDQTGYGAYKSHRAPANHPHGLGGGAAAFNQPRDDPEDQQQDDRPNKRAKPNPADDDFDDEKMPCPFRFSHPEIYDRDNKEKYSPCHTLHKEISTLVRHLARPAHRLAVHEKSISSFAVVEDDGPHPAAGLCRRCWRVFSHQAEFNVHLDGTCPKVSRSKREKWRTLYDTFCPIEGRTPTPTSDGFDSDDESDDDPDDEGNDDGIGEHDPNAVSHIMPPGNTTGDLARRASSSAPAAPTGAEGGMVPMRDHLALAQRVSRLEQSNRMLQESNRRLASMTKATMAMLLPLRNRAAGPRPATQRGAATATAGDEGLRNLVEGATGDDSVSESTRERDRESLIGHMTSQPTDVNRDGLMDEVQRDFAGPRISESPHVPDVRRVPLSPPPTSAKRPLGTEGDAGGSHYRAHAAAAAAAGQDLPAPRSDSGYGTQAAYTRTVGAMADLPAFGSPPVLQPPYPHGGGGSMLMPPGPWDQQAMQAFSFQHMQLPDPNSVDLEEFLGANNMRELG